MKQININPRLFNPTLKKSLSKTKISHPYLPNLKKSKAPLQKKYQHKKFFSVENTIEKGE
jgi:hypothetical protein